jgi:glycosyltransferase involved in cell wall biosynthesis
MTVSVLAGREGRQARELHRMVSYLKSQERPAVLSISNMLLSGVAPELRRELGVPLVSGFLGEDSFLDALAEPYRREAHEQLRKNAAAVDLFLAPGEACAEKMTKYLGIPRHKVKVIRIGVDVDVYPAAAARPRTPFTVGYLSVLTPQKGLDVLVEAFRRLAVDERRDVRLRVGGRVLDRGYWRAIQRTVTRAGLQSRFEHLGEVDLAGKVALMQNCSAFALPSRIEEAKGLAVMEAMACGAPALAPGSGVFPELFARTGGGVCFDPDDPGTLARELARLMDDPEAADEMGRAAAAGIRKDYSAARMVEEVEAEFTGLARSQG